MRSSEPRSQTTRLTGYLRRGFEKTFDKATIGWLPIKLFDKWQKKWQV